MALTNEKIQPDKDLATIIFPATLVEDHLIWCMSPYLNKLESHYACRYLILFFGDFSFKGYPVAYICYHSQGICFMWSECNENFVINPLSSNASTFFKKVDHYLKSTENVNKTTYSQKPVWYICLVKCVGLKKTSWDPFDIFLYILKFGLHFKA